MSLLSKVYILGSVLLCVIECKLLPYRYVYCHIEVYWCLNEFVAKMFIFIFVHQVKQCRNTSYSLYTTELGEFGHQDLMPQIKAV